MIIYSN